MKEARSSHVKMLALIKVPFLQTLTSFTMCCCASLCTLHWLDSHIEWHVKHLYSMSATVVTNLKMGIYCCDISQFREVLFSNQGWFRECQVQAWQEAAALQAAVQLHRESTGCSAIQAARSQYLRDEHHVRVPSCCLSRVVNQAELAGFCWCST